MKTSEEILRHDNRLLRERLFAMSNRIKDLLARSKRAEKDLEDLEYRHHRQVGDEVTVLLAKRLESLQYRMMDFVLGHSELAAENEEDSK